MRAVLLDWGVEWVNSDHSTYISAGRTETSAHAFVADYRDTHYPKPVRVMCRTVGPWRASDEEPASTGDAA